MQRGQMGGKKPDKTALKNVGAIFKVMLAHYALPFLIVVACILGSSFCMLQSTLFTQRLIDDFITPLLAAENPDFGPLAAAIGRLGIIAVVPILISHFSSTASLTGLSIGGTSIMIAVGVALETVRALEAQMIMRNYKGFLS